jgi:hypothetical protein
MSKAWYIKLKRQIRGFDPDEDSACPDHRAVGRAIKRLDNLANDQGWQPLSAFLSEDPDIAIDLLDDEDEDEVDQIIRGLGRVRWFKPEDAKATVDNLIDALEEMPRRLGLKSVKRVVEELRDLQQTLDRAAAKQVAFRFYAEFG